jgi:hypothetical protein
MTLKNILASPTAVGLNEVVINNSMAQQIDVFGEHISIAHKKAAKRRDYDAEARALIEASGILKEPKEVIEYIIAKLLADELPQTVIRNAHILKITDLQKKDAP